MRGEEGLSPGRRSALGSSLGSGSSSGSHSDSDSARSAGSGSGTGSDSVAGSRAGPGSASAPALGSVGRAPIGVFDSGVGGLSVLRAVRRVLPGEPLVYLADHAHAPYGDRSPDAITDRTLRIGHWLVQQGCRAVVVACNTATAVAVEALREALGEAVPVVAIEPAVKPAALATRSGVIGVLATTATVASERLARLCEAHAHPRGVRVLMLPAPGLVERVEAGDLDGPDTRTLLERQLAPFRAAGGDVLVLGCTHYPFLAPALQAVLGPDVQCLDPAEAVARELVRRLGAPARDTAAEGLNSRGVLNALDKAQTGSADRAASDAAGEIVEGSVRLFTTGDAATVDRVVRRLWPQAPAVVALRGV